MSPPSAVIVPAAPELAALPPSPAPSILRSLDVRLRRCCREFRPRRQRPPLRLLSVSIHAREIALLPITVGILRVVPLPATGEVQNEKG